jgi:predicted short-subunit dehydrogenase-like oxidoreductase (DUF2520 family)
MSSERSYWVVGPGRAGTAFASVLAGAGVLVIGRSELAPDHPVMKLAGVRYATDYPGPPSPGTRVLLSVPDDTVAAVAAGLARLGEPGDGCVALHVSGALPASILEPLARRGYATGSLHPLQTLADPQRGAERLRGSFCTFEGDPAARNAATEIVEAAGGRMLEVHAADKARYHAACVFASNYVVACAAAATRLLSESVGVSREEAARALQPLWSGATANLEDPGLPQALTGPIARGDLETVRANLSALDDESRELYARLGLEALQLSRELGLDPATAEAVEAELRRNARGGTEQA